ncbi:MAG: DUF5627 domain-containing protein [Bacteroidales bacterium]|nr:DUF5627 domain-containing protein [Bacteroidales bacterium]
MNKFKNIVLATATTAVAVLTGCENADKTFPDYEGGISVYFPYQAPVRTLIMGSDEYEQATALDREHKCKIMATMGGAYKGKNITIDFIVDNSLVDPVNEVKAMPSEYYNLASNQIKFNGNPNGGVEVQLTDAFFADPEAVKTTYVIPLIMTTVKGANSIITGKPNIDGTWPLRVDAEAWAVQPQDYVLYAVKYINKYHGSWLRMRDCEGVADGKRVTDNSLGREIDQKTPTVNITTVSLTEAQYEVDVEGNKCVLDLAFDGSENCTVSTKSEGWTVSNASGKFTSKGAKYAWGQKDRDLIELSYTIENTNGVKLTSKERLVWQKHGIAMPEEFSFTINK